MLLDLKNSVNSQCVLPPVESLLDAANFDLLSSMHNGMGCQIVSQYLFDIVNQPTMFQDKLTLTEFETLSASSLKTETFEKSQNALLPALDASKLTTRKTRSQVLKTDNDECSESKPFKVQSVNLYKCNYGDCEEVFSKKSLLDFHIDVHRGVRILCTEPACTRSFTSQLRLRNHIDLKHKEIEK